MKWYSEMSVDYSIPLSTFLDPPAVCFRPDRKDPLSKFKKRGSNVPVLRRNPHPSLNGRLGADLATEKALTAVPNLVS